MTTPSRSNFAFVGPVFPRLLSDCRGAEAAAVSNPRASAIQARFVTEAMIKHISAFYGLETGGAMLDLARAPKFRQVVPPSIQNKIHALRKIGNVAAHEDKHIEQQVAIHAIAHLYDLMVWAAANVADRGRAAIPNEAFDPQILFDAPKQQAKTAAQLRKLQFELDQREQQHALQLSEERERLRAEREEHLRQQERFRKESAEQAAEIARLRAELEEKTRAELVEAQAEAGAVDTTANFAISEADTRRDIINPMLAAAGFSVEKGNVREEVQLPSGRADYVLYGEDGKALAVVEAKKPSVSISAGRQQAARYARELEAQFGQRPIIYYTTGYLVEMWDDVALPSGVEPKPREVDGYATARELYQLIRFRTLRQDLTKVTHDSEIAGRPYQAIAIRAVAEHLSDGYRKALLVMATGTGKTRTAIALVKMLKDAGWVKNVLFLADRKALVNQAAKNFSALYPDAGIVNLLKESKTDGTVYLSTYQSMIKQLGEKFTPYAFDLVIVDEAHRSIYRRYRRIFDYFDSYLIGLTATPRDEIDHNTYSMFDLQDGQPTTEYSLEQAVSEGYLVHYRPYAAESIILQTGVRYENLSEEDKVKWDLAEWGTDEDGNKLESPEGADASEINAKLYNLSTIDLVLKQVLTHGIKVDGADRIGKTIIFARNQYHADLIYKRFSVVDPKVSAEVITSGVDNPDELIERFEDPSPRGIDVAISVDMLDTGIDVPEIVNLVFFKPVHSQTKFWQMIGRGTRTRKDLFGEGLDKEEFFVFDYCDNLRHFAGADKPATEGSKQRSLSERLFLRRLELLDKSKDVELRASIRTHLQKQLGGVPESSPLVSPKARPILDRYREPASWESLSAADYADMEEHLANLPFASAAENEHAKRFDLVVLGCQTAVAEEQPVPDGLRLRVQRLATNLLTKLNVKAIAAQAKLLEQAASDEWWDGVTEMELEVLRRRMRSLVHNVDRGQRNAVVMDIKDELGELNLMSLPLEGAAGTVVESTVEQKIQAVLDKHGDALVLKKIRRAKPLTGVDIVSLEQLVASAGISDVPSLRTELGMSLPRFVRTMVGLEETAAREVFADWISGSRLNATQLAFLNRVVGGLVQNGIVTMGDLWEAPYNDYGDPLDVFDGNTAMVYDLRDRLQRIEQSVEEIS